MNERFRAIGLDTEDKITEFIDYIDDLEDTEEIKSDVYGFFDAFCASQWPLVRLPVATWRYEWPEVNRPLCVRS